MMKADRDADEKLNQDIALMALGERNKDKRLEAQLENQKTLAVFKNNLIESGKNKRNILGNLAQIIAQTSSTRQRRELLENYKKLAIKFANPDHVPTAEDIETSLGVIKTKEQQGVNTSDGDATFDSSNTNQRRQVVQPVS